MYRLNYLNFLAFYWLNCGCNHQSLNYTTTHLTLIRLKDSSKNNTLCKPCCQK